MALLSSAPTLRCDADLVESAIYDYGEVPLPDGQEPLEAVEAFFGSGVPQDAELDVQGLKVHVIQDDRTVAIIGLLNVPGGYVVESYDACAGTIAGGWGQDCLGRCRRVRRSRGDCRERPFCEGSLASFEVARTADLVGLPGRCEAELHEADSTIAS